MKKLILPFAVAALVASACMSTESMSPREPVAEREYPTGSNLPRRASNSGSQGAVSNTDRDAMERSRDTVTLPQMGPGVPKAQ